MELILLNKKIKIFKTSELIELGIKTPEIQRIIDRNKLDEIVKYQLNEIKKNKCVNFLGVINVHLCLEDNKYYLVDGQHRYQALMRLYHDHSQDPNIFLEIVNVKNLNELRENYSIINKNTPLPDFNLDIDKTIPEDASDIFQLKYKDVWSNTSRAHRPHMYLNYFQESLGYIAKELELKSSKELIEIIESYNSDMKNWERSSFKSISDTMYDKSKKWDFYLGLYSHSSNDEWGYEWAREIIKNKTGKNLKKFKIKARRKIPKKIKNDCWDKYIGKTVGCVYCLVCDREKIYQNNFEAGHIVSDKDGGKCDISNLLPICSCCNKSISSKNMTDYVNDYYPLHLERYTKRKYRNLEA